jgi:PIN domain nuclease of toxin-antitoxin system
LSKIAKIAIEKTENNCFASIASFWEMSIKLGLGKMDLEEISLQNFIKKVVQNGIEILEINENHVLVNEKLPFHHRDPFDRIIISQAIFEKMRVISTDFFFDKYEIERIG